jgi:recombinase
MAAGQRVVVREAPFVVRLAYTRTQAAEALGISRSTFIRRVLPYVETVALPSGGRLVPVDEVERLVRERRRAPLRSEAEPKRPGRPRRVAAEVVERIREARAAGESFAAIADSLTTDRVPTAHGGKRWWPSTVRAIAARGG